MIKTRENITFQIISHAFMITVSLCMIIPMILLLVSSFTDENVLIAYGYSFFPKKFSLIAYQYIFQNGNVIFRAYGITIFVTIVGTTTNIIMSSMLAYALSLKHLPGKSFFNFYVFFTMLFNGGLVPTYLMYSGTFHIKNTIFALIVPGFLMSAMNVLLMRSYFTMSIPTALFEAAEIDGAGQFTIYRKIVLPLGKPIIVTVGLFSGLGYWNDWTNGLYYLTNAKLYGIQNLLNKMLTDSQYLASHVNVATPGSVAHLPSISVKMAIALVAVLPILVIYPFLQKYFQNGLTLGAVKG